METICSITPCPAARALVTVIDQGERADFFAQAMDAEFDMPWALTAAVEIAAQHGCGIINAFEGMAYGGQYAPGYPAKERAFERLSEEYTILLLRGFKSHQGWLGKRIGFNFDTGEMLLEHDQALFPERMPDGSWQMDAWVNQKLGRMPQSALNQSEPVSGAISFS